MTYEESDSLAVGDVITNTKTGYSLKVVKVNPIPEDRHSSYDLESLTIGEHSVLGRVSRGVFAMWLNKDEWIKEPLGE